MINLSHFNSLPQIFRYFKGRLTCLKFIEEQNSTESKQHANSQKPTANGQAPQIKKIVLLPHRLIHNS